MEIRELSDAGDRAFDFDRRDADPVAVLEHLVGRDRLAIDADQVVAGLAPCIWRSKSWSTVVPSLTSMWSKT